MPDTNNNRIEVLEIPDDLMNRTVTDISFKTSLDYSFQTIDDDVIFSNCIFHDDVNFSTCIFKKRVFFSNCEFKASANFSFSKFEGFCSFADSTFHGLCLFTSTNAISLMNYSDVKFADKAEVDFHCSHFEQFANLDDVQIKYANLHMDYRRENARILKHYCINTNDKVMAFLFHKFEMKATLARTTKISDKVILNLNQISSDFGTNWVKAFLFTIIISVVLFISFYCFGVVDKSFEWGWESWNSFFDVLLNSIKHFCLFINPTHSINDFKGLDLNSFGYGINLVARILIGYGIYQLVVSSRIFSRNI